MTTLSLIRRECPRASREWRSTLYRRAKVTRRRGHRAFHRSVTESARQLHRRESRRLIERRAGMSMDRGLHQWEPK